jgi:hypothetical protein
MARFALQDFGLDHFGSQALILNLDPLYLFTQADTMLGDDEESLICISPIQAAYKSRSFHRHCTHYSIKILTTKDGTRSLPESVSRSGQHMTSVASEVSNAP